MNAIFVSSTFPNRIKGKLYCSNCNTAYGRDYENHIREEKGNTGGERAGGGGGGVVHVGGGKTKFERKRAERKTKKDPFPPPVQNASSAMN